VGRGGDGAGEVVVLAQCCVQRKGAVAKSLKLSTTARFGPVSELYVVG
jgi:hypothetical protein